MDHERPSASDSAGKIPEAWIGQEVMIETTEVLSSNLRASAPVYLEDVNERGIVMLVTRHRDQNQFPATSIPGGWLAGYALPRRTSVTSAAGRSNVTDDLTRRLAGQILRGVKAVHEENNPGTPLGPGTPVGPHAAAERIGSAPWGAGTRRGWRTWLRKGRWSPTPRRSPAASSETSSLRPGRERSGDDAGVRGADLSEEARLCNALRTDAGRARRPGRRWTAPLVGPVSIHPTS